MAEPNPAAVREYGTEEKMVETLIAAGLFEGKAREMAALEFGTSEGDVDLSEIPEIPEDGAPIG